VGQDPKPNKIRVWFGAIFGLAPIILILAEFWRQFFQILFFGKEPKPSRRQAFDCLDSINA
jgi:hypothetical protein